MPATPNLGACRQMKMYAPSCLARNKFFLARRFSLSPKSRGPFDAKRRPRLAHANGFSSPLGP